MNAFVNTPAPILAGMPFAPYTLTRSIPEVGESFLQMYPHRSNSSMFRSFFLLYDFISSVKSVPVVAATRRGSSGLPTRRIASLGDGNPHSTSGQTGTNSTKRPSVSARKGSLLWPPSYRTFSPSRQELMRIRTGPSGTLFGGVPAVSISVIIIEPRQWCILLRDDFRLGGNDSCPDAGRS
jgi:hypothetical protein